MIKDTTHTLTQIQKQTHTYTNTLTHTHKPNTQFLSHTDIKRVYVKRGKQQNKQQRPILFSGSSLDAIYLTESKSQSKRTTNYWATPALRTNSLNSESIYHFYFVHQICCC